MGTGSKSLRLRASLAIVLSVFFLQGAVLAADWEGNESSNWDDTDNWSGGAVPTNGSDINIDHAEADPPFSTPWELTHPGMVLSGNAEQDFEDAVASLDNKSHPSDWDDSDSNPITTMIASSADSEIVLLENGDEIARSRLTIDGPPILGEHVLVLQGTHDGQQGLAWQGISHHEDPAYPHKPEEAIVDRVSADNDFIREMRPRMHPGMVLIVTDLPAHPDRRSGDDFVIIDSGPVA